jgi:hypothetical protein
MDVRAARLRTTAARVASSILLIASVRVASVAQPVPIGGEFQIASGPPGYFYSYFGAPDAAMNDTGAFDVVWSDGEGSIRGQLFDGAGRRVGDELLFRGDLE